MLLSKRSCLFVWLAQHTLSIYLTKRTVSNSSASLFSNAFAISESCGHESCDCLEKDETSKEKRSGKVALVDKSCVYLETEGNKVRETRQAAGT